MITIESRLAAVERQIRFHRTVIAGLLVALVALVGYGATQGVPDVIRAGAFVVVNSKGVQVAKMFNARGHDEGYIEVNNGRGELTVLIESGATAGEVCVRDLQPPPLYQGRNHVAESCLKATGSR